MSKKSCKRPHHYMENSLNHPESEFFRGTVQEFRNESVESFNKAIFALIILILIVLQFGRAPEQSYNVKIPAYCEGCDQIGTCFPQYNNSQNNQLIDNSVLFIIVFFLLIVCSGCLPKDIY